MDDVVCSTIPNVIVPQSKISASNPLIFPRSGGIWSSYRTKVVLHHRFVGALRLVFLGFAGKQQASLVSIKFKLAFSVIERAGPITSCQIC